MNETFLLKLLNQLERNERAMVAVSVVSVCCLLLYVCVHVCMCVCVCVMDNVLLSILITRTPNIPRVKYQHDTTSK